MIEVRRFRAAALRESPLGVSLHAGLDAPIEPGDAFFLEVAELDPGALAAQLPPPTLGVPVVLGPRMRRRSTLARLFGASSGHVPRGVRGAALLLAGYVEIGGAVDPVSGLDLAWGLPQPS